MRKSMKLAAAGVLMAGLTSGTLAFTAGNTVPSSTAGYGESTVSGATANSIAYTFSANGATITGASIVFAGNQTGKTAAVGFNGGAQTDCTMGTHDATANTTTATCSGLSQATADATTLAVSVR